jgi:F-type H+-transporting ATPase subunit epsilon
MAASFQFELVSPEKLIVSQDVTMVTVPGGEGDYGVLAGHAPLITTVRPGVINVYAQDDATITDRIFVSGGFAEVTQDRCTVLADGATPVAELDRVRVEEHLQRLLQELSHNHQAETGHEALEHQVAIARAQLQAISQPN